MEIMNELTYFSAQKHTHSKKKKENNIMFKGTNLERTNARVPVVKALGIENAQFISKKKDDEKRFKKLKEIQNVLVLCLFSSIDTLP